MTSLILNAQGQRLEDDTLRKDVLTRMGFPAWVCDLAEPHTLSPVLASVVRGLAVGPFEMDARKLPELLAFVKSAEGSKVVDARQRSGLELRRLLILMDCTVRTFLVRTLQVGGFEAPAKMLRAMPPLTDAQKVYAGQKAMEKLADAITPSDPNNLEDKQVFAVTAVSFAGLMVTAMTGLLRAIQDSLMATQGSSEAKADVMEVDGMMVYDMVTHALVVYGSARSAATMPSLLMPQGNDGTQVDAEGLGMLKALLTCNGLVVPGKPD